MNYQILKGNQLIPISEAEFAEAKLSDETLFNSSVIYMDDCGTTYTLIPVTNVRYGAISHTPPALTENQEAWLKLAIESNKAYPNLFPYDI